MFSFHLSFLTSLITNPLGLQHSPQALSGFRTLNTAGISKISHSMTKSLENVFWQMDVSKQCYSYSDHSLVFSFFLLRLPLTVLLLTKQVIILGCNKKFPKSMETAFQIQSVPSLKTCCCKKEMRKVRLGFQ